MLQIKVVGLKVRDENVRADFLHQKDMPNISILTSKILT